MHTYSETIITTNDIDIFVANNDIEDNDQLLIQFFCGTTDIKIIQEFQKYFKINFPKATLLGSTSDGIIDADVVHILGSSLLVFTLFKETTLRSLILDHDDSFHDYFKSGYMLASNLITNKTKAFISFADGIHTNGEEFVNGISSFNKGITIAGGLAGDNGKLLETYVFDKEYASSNGAIAVALDSDTLQVTTEYSFDWMPIGKQLSVTKSIDNRVYEIDGMSAVDLYAKYLGEDLASLLPQLGIEYPLIIERDGIDTARAILFKHEDGSLTFAGNILEGELVRFGIGNIDTILQGGESNLRSILKNSSKKIETFFIYSCMARRRFMGKEIEKELTPFSKIASTAGFFTYGEFFHNKKGNQLLNESMTILALSESIQKQDVTINNSLVQKKNFTANPVHIVSHLTNIISSELENLNENLESRIQRNTDTIYKQAYYEKLTGLPNRLKLIHDLSDHVGKTLLLLNIDDFTLVNDFYGHSTGDAVLKGIASTLDIFATVEDVRAYKLPSDEYALILEKKYTSKALKILIKTLIKKLKNSYITHDYYQIKVDVTISSVTITPDELGLANANMALKLAKKQNLSYLIFDEALMISKNYEINLNMATTIREAIDTDNIVPYFQPIYDANTGKINKYECLVRLITQDNEVLTPCSFLEISQKIKLYPQITKIMIEKTFSYFYKNGLDFSINLSFSDILSADIHKFLFKKIKKYKIAKQLTIEILETQAIDNQDAIKKFIEKLYNHGASIAIDDFGSGYANFQHMTTIRANYLKIDGSLIKNIDTDHNARLVVETIIIFAKKLNMKTIAEFVHSKEVYDVVCELNIDLLQGYYLDKPLKKI